ncbi:hypothetical protein [Ensifer sp.]|uniref:hypothetical protein n=1 Tax=Ensifer sp. TaxID=1872086 RepID=UPI00289E2DEE|nr:hypothetical protein [Ensifer sp.]
MSVLALAFFSDLQSTLRARLLSHGRSLLAAASMPLPAIPNDKPHLLRDAGCAQLPFKDRWEERVSRDAVFRSHWLL